MPIVKNIHNNVSIDVPAGLSLSQIKDLVCKTDSNWSNKDFGIFYLGRELLPQNDLPVDFGAVKCPILFALVKPEAKSCECEKPTTAEIHALLTNMQTSFTDRNYRALAIRSANNPETLQNLIEFTPGLRFDHTAQAVLKDPFLLVHWMRSPKVNENFANHPSLFYACQQLLENMHAEIQRSNRTGQSGNNEYGEDFPMFSPGDESEESDAESNQANSAAGSSTQTARQQPITAEFLAAALAAATGSSNPGTSTSTATANVNAQRNVLAPPAATATAAPFQGMVTADMFRRAMAQATSSLSQAQPQNTPAQNYETQLAELSGMGFSDRDENLRALRRANGDVQAALEIIISIREAMEQSFGVD